MKFRIPANTLNEAAVFAAKAIGKNPVHPIMGGLHISVEADGVHLTASNYDQTSKAHVEADVDTTGVVVLPALMLTNVLAKLRDRMCVLERQGEMVKLTAGTASFVLHCMPAAEYPKLAIAPAIAGTVDGEKLAHAVNMVIGAAATDDTLPILCGVNMAIIGTEIMLTSTDRYRMASSSLEWAPATEQDFSVLVKGSWLHGLTKSLMGQTVLQHDGNVFGIDAGQRSSVTNIIEGDYPKIRSLFPDNWENEAIIDRAMFAEAVDRVATVAERNTPIRLRFENDTITMDAGTGEASQGEEVITCEYNGYGATAAFNPGFLGWSISTLATEKIILRFQDNMAKPVLLVPTVGDTKHLVMPVRLPNGAKA